MKKFILLALIMLVVVACKEEKSKQHKTEKEVEQTSKTIVNGYASFGEKIESESSISATDMLEKFKTMQLGDTLEVKFNSKINEVCTKKGCWMKLKLDDNTETMVRFKDYGFFMPLDSKGKEVIVEGKAIIKETPVDELKHFAEDAGKSKEEIDAITEPKIEFAFEAHGVLMKE